MKLIDHFMKNRVSGTRTHIVVRARESGDCVKLESEFPARAAGTPMHIHEGYAETFEVLAGQLDLAVGDPEQHIVLRVGESATAPAGVPHRFWNSTAVPVRFTVEIRPGASFETAYQALYRWINKWKLEQGNIHTGTVELALIYALSGTYLTRLPVFLQKPIIQGLAKILFRLRW